MIQKLKKNKYVNRGYLCFETNYLNQVKFDRCDSSTSNMLFTPTYVKGMKLEYSEH